MNTRYRTALAVLILASALAARADVYRNMQETALRDLALHKGSPVAIADLYRADALRQAQPDPAPFVEALRSVAADPGTDPEVAAHVKAKLSEVLADTGRFEEADAIDAGMGYVSDWLVLGPFDDDNKGGYDAVFEPEKALDFSATYFGKGHQAEWRRLPKPVKRGLVPLGEALDPSEKVVGYAAAFVKAPKDTPCVVRGGYNEAYKLWVDGEAVGGRKVYNGRAFDQHADACTLRAGWNVLLVKVCNQEAGWNFSIRLTDPSGRALKGLRYSSDPASLGESLSAVLKKDGGPPKGFSYMDPGESLRVTSEKAGTPESAEAYGLYAAFLRLFDRTDLEDIRLLEAAAKGDPGNPSYWLALGDAERDHNKSRSAYEKALAASPGDPAALAALARYTVTRGMPFPALDYLRRALESDPGSPALQAYMAQIQLRGASDGAAAKRLKDLYDKYPGCQAVQRAYRSALEVMGEDTALDAVKKDMRASAQNQSDAWSERAEDLLDRGRAAEGLEVYTQAEARFPYDRFLFRQHAAALLGLNRPAEALAVMDGVLSWAPDWPEGHQMRGDALEGLGRRDDALEAYRRALVLKPQMEDLKRKVAFLSPREEGFEAPYRVKAEDLPVEPSREAGQQAVVLLDSEVVKVQPGGLASRYVQRVFKILRTEAARDFQSVPITFDPDREEVRILDASVIKPDGRRVHADSMVTDALSDPQVRLYYRNRNLVLSFPSITAGDLLWIEYKISDVGDQNEYGRYFGDIVPFGSGVPVLRKEYTLILPASLTLHIHAQDLQVEPMVVGVRDQKTYRWVVKDIEPLQREPGMPGPTEVQPYLHVSTFENWDAMGAWYAKFIADQWEVTPAVKQQVADLVKGLTTPEAKVKAIHRWVVQQTRYVGLEFGVHGFRPYKVRQIFERRFGDCKDKALLMTAMLREAGLDASMVLVRTRSNGAIAETPASLAIFNHAICYVPELDVFLDGTAEYSGMNELPYQDQGVWVLLVWPDGRTSRRKTPQDVSSANVYAGEYDLDLKPGSADLNARGRLTVKGQECPWFRERYQDADRFPELLEKDLSASFPGTRITAATRSDPRNLGEPVEVSFEGTLGQIAKPDGRDRVSLPLWMGGLNLSSTLGSLETREMPLVMGFPWTRSYTVKVALPAGATATPPPAFETSGAYGAIVRTVTQEEGRVTVTTTVRIDVTRVEPKDYPGFRAFCLQADRTADERLRVQFAGGQP